MRTIKKYGWNPGLPTLRSKLRLLAPPDKSIIIPSLIDLRTDGCEPPVYNQLELGSCTANSSDAMVQSLLMKLGLPSFIPSRLFTYYNTRAEEGTVDQDGGGSVADAVLSLEKYGVCPETEWEYNVDQFAVKPPDQCFKDAAKNKVLQALSLSQDINHIGGSLALKFRIVFGFTVYESFESDVVAKTGIVPMPTSNQGEVGGHAVELLGKDDSRKVVIVRNSWGSDWGDKGYFYLPYDYVLNPDLASDFWTARKIA